jgi:hypothetical protein
MVACGSVDDGVCGCVVGCIVWRVGMEGESVEEQSRWSLGDKKDDEVTGFLRQILY